ncbi:hypothetical protein BN946_scf184844.g92 [Trametes cinnabarina]|uniref:Uncharacterized protein n=1 Tax=Pycnoporus cinnabarinus TaxID=5643 RepID=A0A060SFA4_PYCCI|nr:hypothetical protein BN946_scf184844.g92 [Trametes cinnabarina]
MSSPASNPNPSLSSPVSPSPSSTPSRSSSCPSSPASPTLLSPSSHAPSSPTSPSPLSLSAPSSSDPPSSEPATAPPMADSIRVEYHPNSGIPTKVFAFEDFSRYRSTQSEPTFDREPWFPYRLRTDFEFAKFSLDASLSKKEITTLLELVHRVREGKDELTFTKYTDVQQGWAAASSKLTPFTKHTVTVPYKKEFQSHSLYTRDVWDYLKDILCNPYLVSRMDWNAHRLHRFDEDTQTFVRFYDEPLTADAAWEIQSELPAAQCPLLLIVYADKTKLSSFGTAKGYPVVLKCGNLPVDIRNGEGIGGGRVVGWLPILDEKAGEKHKTGYVNLKHIVWHESFCKILEPILKHSHHGVWFHCGDGVDRCLCPCVVILSSDYEEQ